MLRKTSFLFSITLGLLIFVGTGRAYASQVAVVIVDKAIVWADIQRTAALGFIRKDKVVTVGEVLRNKQQVVAIAISGRIGYIAVDDIQFGTTRSDVPIENHYERFYDSAIKTKGKQLVAYGMQFYSTENKNSAANRTGETWNFFGGGIKGEAPTTSERVTFAIAGEYTYSSSVKREYFRNFTLGLGFDFALVNFRYTKLRGELMVLGAFAQYEQKPLFTLNTWGMGGLAQGLLDIYFNQKWGMEAAFGLEALKFFRIARPAPYKNFSPLFSGVRGSIGVAYRFD